MKRATVEVVVGGKERMKKSHIINRSKRSRRGAVVVIVALSMTVLLGMGALVVDYGLMVSDKNRLQRGCDAAALAGASQLKMTGDDARDTAQARLVATRVAAQNNVVVDPNAITFLDNNVKIRVPAMSTRMHHFGPILGIPNGRVAAFALARVFAVTQPAQRDKVVPIGITQSTYNAYKNDTLPHPLTLPRPVDTTYNINNFLLFDLRQGAAKSPSAMASQLLGDSFETVKVGTLQTSLNAGDGTVVSKFMDSLATIFQRSAAAPWNDSWSGNLMSSTGIRYGEILAGTSPRDNPRVMNVLVNADTTSPTGGGTFNVPVLSFAPVYIESFQQTVDAITGETTNTMTVRFLPPVFTSGSGIITDGTVTPGGLRSVGLVG